MTADFFFSKNLAEKVAKRAAENGIETDSSEESDTDPCDVSPKSFLPKGVFLSLVRFTPYQRKGRVRVKEEQSFDLLRQRRRDDESGEHD